MCSGQMAADTGRKVVAFVKKQRDKARRLILGHMDKLHELAKYLYERETITGEEFMEILSRK